MEYQTIFHLIAALSAKTGATCVLIGGYAVNYYKVTRQTQDVDLLITQDDFQKISRELEKAGFKSEGAQKIFARFSADGQYLMDIDFLFVGRETLKKIVASGTEIRIAGQKFIVPSLDNLIALKLHALKNNLKQREYKDLPDIINLIRTNDVKSRSAGFKELCLKYGTQALYKKILKAI